MTDNDSPSELITQIYEAASEWLVRHRAGTLSEADRRAFDLWLRKSPEHIRAYFEISGIWEEDEKVWQGPALPNADALIARARAEQNVEPFPLNVAPADAGSSSSPRAAAEWVPGSSVEAAAEWAPGSSVEAVVAASGPISSVVTVVRQPARPAVRFALAAAVLLVVVAAGLWAYTQRGIYATGIGEQRTLALDDGSTLELNSRSRIRVRFDDRQRAIDLLAGQALFKVARDPARPFIVDSNGTHVRAVGTQFDVYNDSGRTIVTVIEGRVAVGNAIAVAQSPAQPAAQPTLLDAGEQVSIAPQVEPKPRRANIEAATAWTQQKLVFDYTPLSQVVQEFNRYNARRLVIEAAELEDFHLSGTFSSSDPTVLLRFLRAQPSMKIIETEKEIRIARP